MATTKTYRQDSYEHLLVPFIKSHHYTYGISGYYIAQSLMYYSDGKFAVSNLGGPQFTTRFLDIERRIMDKGAEFVVYRIEEDELYGRSLVTYCQKRKIGWTADTVAKYFVVYHNFTVRIHPGEYLPTEAQPHFERHTFTNPRKIQQEKANIMLLYGT